MWEISSLPLIEKGTRYGYNFKTSEKKKREKKRENFVLLEGHSQILLEATCPPHFSIFFLVVFVLVFVCLLLQLCFLYNKKKM